MGFSIENMKAALGSNAGLARGNMFLVTLPTAKVKIPKAGGSDGGLLSQATSFIDELENSFNSAVNILNSAIDSIAGSVGLNTGFQQPEDLSVLCRAVNLPGRQIMSHDSVIGVHRNKVAYGYADNEVSLTFLMTNNMKAKEFFEAWQMMCVDPKTGQSAYLEDYAFDVDIKHLKKGAGIPVTKDEVPTAKRPNPLTSRLPKVGPYDFGTGSFNVSLFTGNDVTRTYRLIDAWPTSVTDVQLSDDADGLLEVTVVLTYKRWEAIPGSVNNGLLGATVGALLK